MTNEDKLNETLRKTFPNTVFPRGVNFEKMIQEIYFTEEWLSAEYKADIYKGVPLPKAPERLTNSEWLDFLTDQFNISRTSAKEMLHVMMSVKREDNFKKQFNGRK